MPKKDDSFVVVLRENHCNWGEKRYTDSRTPTVGEAYIPIPVEYARLYGIYNSNINPNKQDQLGVNLFYAYSEDGFVQKWILKAQGSSTSGDIYAKQFSVKNDLKKIGTWFKTLGASEGDSITVTWTSPNEIRLKFSKAY